MNFLNFCANWSQNLIKNKLLKIILLFFALFFISCSLESGKDNGKIGTQAPELMARSLNGDFFKLSDAPNSVQILVFFKNGCSSCLEILPLFDNYLQSSQKISVFAIDFVDKKEIIKVLAEQLRLKNIHVLSDEMELTRQNYAIFGTPSIIILKDGIIKERILGEKSWEFIERKFSSLL